MISHKIKYKEVLTPDDLPNGYYLTTHNDKFYYKEQVLNLTFEDLTRLKQGDNLVHQTYMFYPKQGVNPNEVQHYFLITSDKIKFVKSNKLSREHLFLIQDASFMNSTKVSLLEKKLSPKYFSQKNNCIYIDQHIKDNCEYVYFKEERHYINEFTEKDILFNGIKMVACKYLSEVTQIVEPSDLDNVLLQIEEQSKKQLWNLLETKFEYNKDNLDKFYNILTIIKNKWKF